MKIIKEVERLEAKGHYALAVAEGGLVYVSGQFSVDPQSGEQKHGSIEEEVAQALENVELILRQVDSDRSRVLKATVYISDLALWPAVDTTYAAFFGEHTPARTVITAKELHYGFKTEIEVIASCG